MIQAICEEPLIGLLVGGIPTGLLTFFGLKSGSRRLLAAAAVGLLLTVMLVALEPLIETDREMMTEVVHAIAEDAEANKIEQLLEHIHPRLENVRTRAASELQGFRVQVVEITQIHEVEINRSTKPPTAVVKLNASVRIDHPQVGSRPVLRYIEATFEETDGRWLVVDYFHDDPLRESRN